jgi:hypothetical protein
MSLNIVVAHGLPPPGKRPHPLRWGGRRQDGYGGEILQTDIAAKLVVIGLASNGFSISDPDDGGMVDVVGFDTETPSVIAGFVTH